MKKKCKTCKKVIKNSYFIYEPYYFCNQDCIGKYFTKLERFKDES